MEKLSSIIQDTESSSLVSESSFESAISDYRPQFKSRKTKQLRSKRSNYQNISNDLRAVLIKKVIDEKQKIKPIAKKLGINYSTAKSILQIYRKEGRTDKKLVPRQPGQLDEFSEEKPQEDSLLQNMQSEHKSSKEQRRYSLRKREAVKTDAMLLPSLQKQEKSAHEPRRVKKIKVAENNSIIQSNEDSCSENTKSKDSHEAMTPEHNISQCTTDHSPKFNQMAEMKDDDISSPVQPKILNIARPFAIRSPVSVPNDLQRQNMLLQVIMPILPNLNQQLPSNNLLNLNIYNLLNSQLQQQASKLLMLSGNPHQNASIRVPSFQSLPIQNFLLNKSIPVDFNQRISFKK